LVERDEIEIGNGLHLPRVFVSAVRGSGLDTLRAVVKEAVAGSLTSDGATPSTVAFVDLDAIEPDEPLTPLAAGNVHSSART
jgi:hypothetical protein